MRWREIYDILINYEKETRKGWYSYTWANGSVSIARRCDPERIYTLNTRDNRVFIEVPIASEESDIYYWHIVGTEYAVDDVLVDADDYFIASGVSHPYIAMLNIKEAEVKTQPPIIFKDFQYHSEYEINEKKINLRALNNIKAFVYEQDRYCYNKRWGWPMPEAQTDDAYIADTAWCGISYNDYAVANFYFNNQEFYICTNGDISKENKHRRHFKEQEWLFPWYSNKLERDRVLYIRTSSLSLYKGDALKNKKKKIIEGIETILKHSGLENYELIEIRKPYKFQNL